MSKKPTYEELEQKINELENEAFERKKAEEALRESEAKYRTLVEQLPSAIYIAAIDEASTTLFISPQIEEILGFKPDEWKKDHDIWLMQIHPDDREHVLAKVEASHKSGGPFLSEYRMITRDGRTIWIRDQAKIVQDDEGRPLFLQGMMSDITDLKLAEEALRESEERYRTAIEHSNDGVAILKEDRHLYVNQRFAEIFGYDSNKEIIGEPLSLNVHPDDLQMVTDFASRRQKGESVPSRYEFKGIRKDGEPVYIEISVTKATYGGEAVSLAYMRDITDQKQAMDALRESEETLDAINASSPVGIALVRKRILDWTNKAMYHMLGYEEGSLLGETARVLYPDDKEYDRVGRILYPGIGETGMGQTETLLVKKDGSNIHCYIQTCALNPSDPDKGVIVAVMDITDRKLAEEHIHTLTQQLMQAQENERQMISRELHDRVGQDLSTLRIGLDTLIDNQPGVLPETRQRVSELSKMLQDSIMVIRDLSYDLRPPSLDQLGLVRTILQYAHDFSEKTGLSVDFTSAGMDHLRLDSDTEINLYRLIQEGLMNIQKHADARHVSIRLVASYPNIILRIEDDGKGFDVKERLVRALNEKRMGLRSMEERVSLLEGKIRIQSRPGKGTKVLIEVPYEEKKSES